MCSTTYMYRPSLELNIKRWISCRRMKIEWGKKRLEFSFVFANKKLMVDVCIEWSVAYQSIWCTLYKCTGSKIIERIHSRMRAFDCCCFRVFCLLCVRSVQKHQKIKPSHIINFVTSHEWILHVFYMQTSNKSNREKIEPNKCTHTDIIHYGHWSIEM